MHVGAIGSFEVGETEYTFAIRELMNRRDAFGLVGQASKVTLCQNHWLRSFRHRHRCGLSHRQLLVHGLVDKEQFRPESIPGDGQRDGTYTDNKITLTHR